MAATASAVIAGGTLILGIYNRLKERTESSNDLDILPTLRVAMRELCALRDDREHMYHCLWNRMERTNTYRTWVNHVNEFEEEAEALIQKHENRRQRSIWPRNFISDLGKRMKTKTLEGLHLYGKVIDVMVVERGLERVVKMRAPSIEEYPSRQAFLNKILLHLRKPGCIGIRVYGMMGVGKTVIMKNLNNHAQVEEMFELVIWVNVSDDDGNNISIREMQESIAKRLNITMEGSGNTFAGRIGDELSSKKYLLLLDGVNDDDLDLQRIGIPHRDEDQKRGSKIVLTTWHKHVCRTMVNESVEISRLNDFEAQIMFQSVLGDSRTSKVMRAVIDQCSRLPYLIEKIGSAFIDVYTEEEWETGLHNLTLFGEEGHPAIRKVYQHVRFFCNQLEGHNRDCFLYVALYPGGSEINTSCLLDCWTAENLCNRREHARHILHELKRKSYLQEGASGPEGEIVRMEKYVWNVARRELLADVQRMHLVVTGKPLQVRPDVHWKQKHRICLVDNNLEVLPKCPDSPMLSTLFLQQNRNLNRFPNFFFNNMGNLRVLNLQNTGIVSLPPSLGHLKNLKVFYLNGCTSLLQLPSEIETLSSLEVLDIRGTGVEITQEPFLRPWVFGFLRPWVFGFLSPWVFGFLGWIGKAINGEPNSGPQAPFPCIWRLTSLTRLLVSFNEISNQNVSRDVLLFVEAIFNISVILEELVIDVNSYQIYCNRIINVVRDRVVTMTNLRFLKFIFKDGVEEVIKVVAGNTKIYFPETGDVASFLKLDSTSFEVYVGCSISPDQTSGFNQYERYMKICNMQGRNPTPDITEVLSRCNAFELVNDGDHEHLSQFGAASFNGVQGCLIEGCNKIEAIAHGDDPMILAMDRPMLPELQKLYVKKLPLLKSLWRGQWKAGSMVKLETLLIEECIEIEELLINNSQISSNLPELKKLILIDLPSLTTISTDPTLAWPALEELEIKDCPMLTLLPFSDAPKLRLVKASQSWWDAQDHNVRERLQRTFSPL